MRQPRTPLPYLPPIDARALAAAGRALAAHWGAVAALALFLIIGLAILDDYGMAADETSQRNLAMMNLAHVRGDAGSLPVDHDRFYGAVFEAPLLLAENALGIERLRGIHLSRHLLTYLFFLTGGLAAYVLACRLTSNRIVALFAMLLFLLHPRLYAHSFFNSKDIPFLVTFMIALFLAHRAFTKGGLSSFALAGISIGALVNLRILGVVLLAAILAMQGLDFALAQGRSERKRALLTAGTFVLAGALTAYAAMPYLWSDPVGRAVEWWTTLSNHPFLVYEIFRGTVYRSNDFPVEYLPVWFSITAPPFALALGLAGAGAFVLRGIRAPLSALRNGGLRFGLLLVGCVAAPASAVALLDVNIYNGWRQMYFLWAPFSLLGALGLAWMVSALKRRRLRAAAYAAGGAGLAATFIAMALIHPNQQVFFNFFVDRTTPEYLRTQYIMDYWGHPAREAWERLLSERPSSLAEANTVTHYGRHVLEENKRILPKAALERTSMSVTESASAFVYLNAPRTLAERAADTLRVTHRLQVYDNTIYALAEKFDARAAYRAAAPEEPLDRPVFRASVENGSPDYALVRFGRQVYVRNGAALYAQEPCSEDEALRTRFSLKLVPQDINDLPEHRRSDGGEWLDFYFSGYGALDGDKCIAFIPLPDYAIDGFRLSQDVPVGGSIWVAEINPRREGKLESLFDFRLADGSLVYVKEPCGQADTEPRFFLHVIPERVQDLPEGRRGIGSDNLDFDFASNGEMLDGGCAVSAALPDYPIIGLRTGQHAGGKGLWNAAFEFGRPLP